jgi:hypothetical protein
LRSDVKFINTSEWRSEQSSTFCSTVRFGSIDSSAVAKKILSYRLKMLQNMVTMKKGVSKNFPLFLRYLNKGGGVL